ncbi:MAG: hypothetical protein HC810_06270 [Acaryochloridaceae cyanobacterium RL_2_7]|nr:hypothetical protein [Acaryochloridaceae cyanobacterium RL_2_7]
MPSPSAVNPLIEARDWGFWAVERRIDQAFIGLVGLHNPSAPPPLQTLHRSGLATGQTLSPQQNPMELPSEVVPKT